MVVYLFIIVLVIILVLIPVLYNIVHDNDRKLKLIKQLEIKVETKMEYPSPEELEKTKKIIWSYWNGRELPLAVKIAKYTWKRYNPDYHIVMLDDDTLPNYIDVSIFPKRYPSLGAMHKADVLRIALLEKYGGFWCDSTYFLTRNLKRWENEKYDIGGYYNEDFTTDVTKPVFENWFISVPTGNNKLVTEWRKEFYRAVDYPNHQEYVDELEFGGVDLQKIIPSYKSYLIMHCAFLKVLKGGDYKCKVLKGVRGGPFFYAHRFFWKPSLSVIYLLTMKPDDVPEGIKFRQFERIEFDKYLNLYRPTSTIGVLIN